MSDHGTNFKGATRELKEVYEFLNGQIAQGNISDFARLRTTNGSSSLNELHILEAYGKPQSSQ